MDSVWTPPSQVSRGWPNKCNAQNIVHRVTGGLRECYAREKPPPRHETSADGRLVLTVFGVLKHVKVTRRVFHGFMHSLFLMPLES